MMFSLLVIAGEFRFLQETKATQGRALLGLMLARNANKPISKSEKALLELTDLSKLKVELAKNHYTFAGIVSETAIAYQNNFEDRLRSVAGKILLEYFSKVGDTDRIYHVNELPNEVKSAFKLINRDGTFNHVPDDMPFRLVPENRATLLGSSYSGDVRWPKNLDSAFKSDAELIKGSPMEPISPPNDEVKVDYLEDIGLFWTAGLKVTSRLQIGIKLLEQMDKDYTKLRTDRAKAKEALFFGKEPKDGDFDVIVGQKLSDLPDKQKKQLSEAAANLMVPVKVTENEVITEMTKDIKLTNSKQSIRIPLRYKGEAELKDFLSSVKVTGYSREIHIRMPSFNGKQLSIAEISL